jgi:hypothetical protein
MTKRKPRPPGKMPATFAQAEAEEILAAMSDWPELMAHKLSAAGLDLNDLGQHLVQAKLEAELMNAQDPDTLAVIVYLAEQGHVAAQRALTRYATYVLENPKADPPSSLRAYIVRHMKGLIPNHPHDRSGVIQHLGRDVGIVAMVDAAAARWGLPKLFSSALRYSAAYYVAAILSRHGTPLSERQVRRIYQDRVRLAQRLAKFLIGDQTI